MKIKKLAIIFLLFLCLTLVFVGCQKGYVKVTFYVDGVEEFSYFVDKGSELEEIPDVPYKEGMVGKWSITDFDEISTDLRVDAIYQSDSYTITFVADNVVVATKKLKKNSTLLDIPAVPEKAGYVGEWNVTDFGSIKQDITVSATYTATKYAVQFVSLEEVVATKYVDYGQTLVDIPQVPNHPQQNYSAKWMQNIGTESQPIWQSPALSNISKNLVVEAYYFITIDLKNITNNPSIGLEIDNNVAQIPYGTMPNQDFLGWYSDISLKNEITFPHTFLENQTIYARWTSTLSSTDLLFGGNKVIDYLGSDANVIIPYKHEDTFIEEIAEDAFRDSNIQSITLPSTITKIGKNSFANCINLTNVYFSNENNIVEICDNAFENCTLLINFMFSPYTNTIGKSAFKNCTSLSTLSNLENTLVTEIEEYAFYNCSSIEQIKLPSTLIVIANNAFENVTTATFSFMDINALQIIAKESFKNCYNLSTVTAPNLLEIGENAFSGCKSMVATTMFSTTNLYKQFGQESQDNDYFYTVDGYYVPLTISSVTIIGAKLGESNTKVLITNALYDCYTINTVNFVQELHVIDTHAFLIENYTPQGSLSLQLPNGLKTINAQAFVQRADLVAVSFPNTLESIGQQAFYGLTRLVSVNINSNNALSNIDKDAFKESGWYKSINGLISVGRVVIGLSINSTITSLRKEDFAGKDTIATYAFANNTKLNSIVLGSNILKICEYAFKDCTNLKQLEIANNTVVEHAILSGCRTFEELTAVVDSDILSMFGKDSYDGSYLHGEYYLPTSLTKLNIAYDESTTIITDNYQNYKYLQQIVIAEGFVTINDRAFYNNESLTKITLPSTLKQIGATVFDDQTPLEVLGVFYGCNNLQQVVLPSSSQLEYIGANTFKDTKLQSFVVSKNVTTIAEYAFANTMLTTLNFDSNIDSELVIFDFAFSNITTFAPSFTLNLPPQLVSLGQSVFYNCTSLQNIKLNNGLQNIGEQCFENCDLRSFDLVSSVNLYLEEDCVVTNILSGNNNLTTLTLYRPVLLSLLMATVPQNLTTIKVHSGIIMDYQFANCSNIQVVDLQNITAIGDYAFYNCNNANLKTINIPQTTTSIDDYAFSGCSSLTTFSFLGNPQITTLGNYVFSGNISLIKVDIPQSVSNTTMEGTFNDCNALISTNIPLSVTHIAENTFKNAHKLQMVDIPENVISIGDYAFINCYEMEMQNINFSVLTQIGISAFENCKMLRGIKAENIEQIGENAFRGCDDIREITIIENAVSYYLDNVSSLVTINISSFANTLSENTFENCNNLQMVMVYAQENIESMLLVLSHQTLSAGAKIFIDSMSYDNLTAQITSLEIYNSIFPNPCQFEDVEYLFDPQQKTAKLVSATYNGSVALLPSVIYENGTKYTVTNIGNNVFKNNTILLQVVIPYTIEVIGNNAFDGCTNLQSVVIETGSNLQQIGEFAFRNCTNLVEFALPNSVTTIKNSAFYGCNNLQRFIITTGSMLATIEKYAFYGTSKITNFEIKSALNYLGEYSFAYSGLNSFSFGEKSTLQQIMQYTFGYCVNLTRESVVIPSSVTTISDYAFFKNN